MVNTKRATVTAGTLSLQTRDTEVEPGGLHPINVQMSDQGTLFYQTEYQAARVTTTIIHSSEVDIIALKQNLLDIAITVEFDSGAKYVFTNCVPDGDIALVDGVCTVTWLCGAMAKA